MTVEGNQGHNDGETLPKAPAARRPALRTAPVLAWLRLMRVYSKIERTLATRLRCQGLSVAQFDVLAHVGADEGLTQQELAEALLVSKGNVTQLLDRMERCGWLARRPAGRTNHIYLTDAGRALRARVVPEHEAAITQLMNGLPAGDVATLHRLLRALDRAQEHDECYPEAATLTDAATAQTSAVPVSTDTDRL